MKTDTTERGLETLIMRHMTGSDGLAFGAVGFVAEAAPKQGGSGWFAGRATAYDREFAVDVEQLFTFLTQSLLAEAGHWASSTPTCCTPRTFKALQPPPSTRLVPPAIFVSSLAGRTADKCSPLFRDLDPYRILPLNALTSEV